MGNDVMHLCLCFFIILVVYVYQISILLFLVTHQSHMSFISRKKKTETVKRHKTTKIKMIIYMIKIVKKQIYAIFDKEKMHKASKKINGKWKNELIYPLYDRTKQYKQKFQH